ACRSLEVGLLRRFSIYRREVWLSVGNLCRAGLPLSMRWLDAQALDTRLRRSRHGGGFRHTGAGRRLVSVAKSDRRKTAPAALRPTRRRLRWRRDQTTTVRRT